MVPNLRWASVWVQPTSQSDQLGDRWMGFSSAPIRAASYIDNGAAEAMAAWLAVRGAAPGLFVPVLAREIVKSTAMCFSVPSTI